MSIWATSENIPTDLNVSELILNETVTATSFFCHKAHVTSQPVDWNTSVASIYDSNNNEYIPDVKGGLWYILHMVICIALSTG